MKVRRAVQVFAEAMERKLRANDWKGGWCGMSAQACLARVVEETAELVPLLVAPGDANVIVNLLLHAAADIEDATSRDVVTLRARARVRSEAADVANMTMMLSDVCEALGASEMIGDGIEDRPE